MKHLEAAVDKPQDENGLYRLRYAEFVVPLVKGVQELSSENDELKKQNEAQQKINQDLQDRLAKLEAMMNPQQSITNYKQTTNISSASLEQNIPNPFTLPQQFSSAKIIITDKAGKVLKEVIFTGNGNGSL